MAHENPNWGYTTIGGALFNLGHVVARETVRNILKDHCAYSLSTKDFRFGGFKGPDTLSGGDIKGWSVSWLGYGWH